MTRRKQKGGDYNNKLQFLLVAWLLPFTSWTEQTDVDVQLDKDKNILLTLLLPTLIQGLFTSFFLSPSLSTDYNSFRLWMDDDDAIADATNVAAATAPFCMEITFGTFIFSKQNLNCFN